MTNSFYRDSPNQEWTPGEGANDETWKLRKKIDIDPYQEGRLRSNNYRLLTSAITPRPIGFISTIKSNGIGNLAPFSCFNVICFDPPLFAVSFTNGEFKDTARAIDDNGELTINIISEWLIEASHSTSINAPLEFNEWHHSGLTPLPSIKVRPPHVAESAFSVEAKLVELKHYYSKSDPTKISATVAIVEGIHFHAREDVLNEEHDYLDIHKLKPVGRLGKSYYSTVSSAFALARPEYQNS